jgi:hypothetical protein
MTTSEGRFRSWTPLFETTSADVNALDVSDTTLDC